MNNASRQRIDALVERISYADIVSGTPFNIGTKLPNGVIPVAIDTIILTPFNSVTSDLLDIGHAGIDGGAADGDAYRNDTSLAAAAGTKVASTVLPGLINDTAGGQQLTGTWTSAGGAPTAGEFLVVVSYVEDGREHHTQG